MTVNSKAHADLIAISEFIAGQNVTAALDFLTAAETAFEILGSHPNIGSPRRLRSAPVIQLRSWPIHGFTNYHIYYRLMDESIEVLRIIHGATDEALMDAE